VPYAIFTDPELGRVGTTEREARKAGKRIKVGRYEMRKNGKAREQGDTTGFVKVVVDAETKRLLGAAVLAVEGAELVHLYLDLMNAGAPYTVIKDAVHIHPTMAEALQAFCWIFHRDVTSIKQSGKIPHLHFQSVISARRIFRHYLVTLHRVCSFGLASPYVSRSPSVPKPICHFVRRSSWNSRLPSPVFGSAVCMYFNPTHSHEYGRL